MKLSKLLFTCLIILLIIEKSSGQSTSKPISISLVYLDPYPNSAGGVDASICWRNLSSKTIKYISFTLTPYNRVDDACFDEITKKSTKTIKDTGPFESGFNSSPKNGGAWANVWYNYDISYCILSKVSIQYLDGTSQKIEGLKIRSIDNYVEYLDTIRIENAIKIK